MKLIAYLICIFYIAQYYEVSFFSFKFYVHSARASNLKCLFIMLNNSITLSSPGHVLGEGSHNPELQGILYLNSSRVSPNTVTNTVRETCLLFHFYFTQGCPTRGLDWKIFGLTSYLKIMLISVHCQSLTLQYEHYCFIENFTLVVFGCIN